MSRKWHKLAAEQVARHKRIIAERGDSEPCCYGHFGCSTNGIDGGPCLDEACHEVERHERETEGTA
jgi:hypothetical protein